MKLKQRLAAVVATSMLFTSVPVFANVDINNKTNDVVSIQSRASDLKDDERQAFNDLGGLGQVSDNYKTIREKLDSLANTADFEEYAAIKQEIETLNLTALERIALVRRLQASYAKFVYGNYTGVTTDKKTGNSVSLIKEKIAGTVNYEYRLAFYDDQQVELGKTDVLITRSSANATYSIIPNLSNENIIVAQAVQGIHVYNVATKEVHSVTLDTSLTAPNLTTYNSEIIQVLMNATVSAQANTATAYRIYNKTVDGSKKYYLEKIKINLSTGKIETEAIADTSTQATGNYTQNQVYLDGVGIYLYGLAHEWALPESSVSESVKKCIMSIGQSNVVYALGGITGTPNTKTVTEIYNAISGSTNIFDKYIAENIEAMYPIKYDRDNTKITDLMEICANPPVADTENPVIHSAVVTTDEWTNTGMNIIVAASDNKVLHDKAYSFDGGVTWQVSNKSPLITENGTISVVVRDASDNLSEVVEVEIDKIDKNAPTINGVTTDPTSFPSNESLAIIEIDAEDAQSGIKEYSFDGGQTWQTNNRKTFTTNTDVTIKVKDHAGNITEYGNTIHVDIKELTGITINGGDKVVMVGETIAVEHTLITKATPNVTWEVHDASLARIDANGNLTGLSAGETSLTAKVEGTSIGQTVNLKVIPFTKLITDFDITQNDLSVKLGQRMTIPKAIAPLDATNQKINWTSSDQTIAMVINDEVVGLKEGIAVITGTTTDGSNLSDAVVVTVTAAGEKITAFDIVEDNVAVTTGGKVGLGLGFTPSTAANKTLNWTSSDSSIAMVVNNQVVGLKPGIAVITGTTTDGSNLSDAVVVTVTAAEVKVTSFDIQEDSVTVNVGQQVTINPQIAPSSATNTKINWTSSDSSIAMVVNNRVIGLKEGIAVITGTTTDGSNLSDAIVVTVTGADKLITKFEVAETAVSVKAGEQVTITKNIAPADATNQRINWVSSDPTIATLVNDQILGLKEGIAVITGTTTDGSNLSNAIVVTVTATDKLITSIAVSDVTTEYKVDDVFDLKGKLTVTYNDSTEEVLPITSSMVTYFNTAKEGTSKVEITYGGKTVIYDITVKPAQKTVTSIAVSDVTTEYKVGDAFDFKGKVTVKYNDATEEVLDITPSMVTYFNTSKAGTSKVEITYGGKTTTYEIKVSEIQKNVQSIEVSGVTTEYKAGDVFDFKGNVNVIYDDGTKEKLDITSSMITKFDTTSAGTSNVEITYGGQTITYVITVKPAQKTVTSLTISDVTTEYKVGDAFDFKGKVTVKYNDATEEVLDITPSMVTYFNTSKAGTSKVEITYGGKTVTYEITVSEIQKNVQSIEVSGVTTEYKVGDVFDFKGNVNVIYDDGTKEKLDITSSMITKFDTTSAGTSNVEITYGGQTVTYVITVKPAQKTVESIKVVGVTKDYKVGDVFDLNGSITVTYDDKTEESLPITSSMVTYFNTSKVGKSNVEITYAGKSTQYEIEVSEKPIQEVTITNSVSSTPSKVATITVTTTGDVAYIVLPNGSKVYQNNLIYKVTENGVYTFTAVSKDGVSMASTMADVESVDKIAPIMLFNYGTDLTTATITAIDNESGIAYILSPDGQTKMGDSVALDATSPQGTYMAFDNAGNSTSKEFFMNRVVINNLNPASDTVTTIALDGIPSTWTNQDVTIQVAANNSEEGIEQVTLVEGAAPAIKGYVRTASTTSSALVVQSILAADTGVVAQDITVEGNTPITYTIQTPSGYAVQTISVDKIDKVGPTVKVTALDNQVTVMAQDDLSGIKTITLSNGASYTAMQDEILSVTEVFNVEGNGTFEAIVEDYAGNITVCEFEVNYDPSNPDAGNVGGDDLAGEDDSTEDNNGSAGEDDSTEDNNGSVGEDTPTEDNNGPTGGGNNGSTGGSTSTGTSSGSSNTSKPTVSDVFKPININKSEMKVTELLNEYVPFTLPVGSFEGQTLFDNRVDALIMDVKAGTQTLNYKYKTNAYDNVVEGIRQGGEVRNFVDVNENQWWYETIANSVKAGYLQGQSETNYGPKATLTYADSLVAINRALVLNGMHDMNLSRTTVETYMSKFDKAHWAYYGFANIMSKMSEEKVAKLTTNGEKVLTTAMTRGELAEILYELLKDQALPQNKVPVSYEDCEATSAVTFCTNTSLMIGVTESTFAPNETLTRAQLATVIDRLANIINE